MKTNRLTKITFLVLTLGFFCTQNQLLSQEVGEKILIDKEILESYAGSYQMEANSILKIIFAGDSIRAEGPGYPPLELVPKSQNRFLLKKFGVDIEFVKSEEGKITKLLMIRADGQSLQAVRIDK